MRAIGVALRDTSQEQLAEVPLSAAVGATTCRLEAPVRTTRWLRNARLLSTSLPFKHGTRSEQGCGRPAAHQHGQGHSGATHASGGPGVSGGLRDTRFGVGFETPRWPKFGMNSAHWKSGIGPPTPDERSRRAQLCTDGFSRNSLIGPYVLKVSDPLRVAPRSKGFKHHSASGGTGRRVSRNLWGRRHRCRRVPLLHRLQVATR